MIQWTPSSNNLLFTRITRVDGRWEVQVDAAATIPPAAATGTIAAAFVYGVINNAT